MNFECECGKPFTTQFTIFKSMNKRQCDDCGLENRSENIRLSYEHVKTYIEKDSNRKLLSGDYKSNVDKLAIQCECGNSFETNFSEFKGGKITCNECTKEKMRNLFNFKIEDVEEYVKENSDCELLSTEYINNSTQLNFKCKCGNDFTQTFANFKVNDKQCEICAQDKRNESKKNSYNYVKNYIETNTNCILLSKTYTNNMIPIRLRCECGTEFEVPFTQVMGGKTHCNKCSLELKGLDRRLTYKEVNDFVEKNSSCELLSTEYKTIKELLIFKCECGSNFEKTFDDFKASKIRKCIKCSNKERGLNGRHSYEYVKEFIEDNNCTLLSKTYDGVDELLDVECNCTNTFRTSFHCFQNSYKRTCGICSKASKGELRIDMFLKSKIYT